MNFINITNRKKLVILVFMAQIIPSLLSAQTYAPTAPLNSSYTEVAPDHLNYSRTISPRVEMLTIPATRQLGDVSEKIVYYDGLGRLVQEVQVGSSPLGKDLIAGYEYDQFGRQIKSYLPYTSPTQLGGSFVGDWKTEQQSYYTQKYPGETPYAETRLENSPLGKMLEQGATGTDWQLGQHSVKYDYQTNQLNEVYWLKIDTSGQLVWGSTNYYPAQKLYKSIVKDENWDSSTPLLHTTEEFKDLLGNVVLKRNYVKNASGGTDILKTYYVYDDFNLLRYVISPEGSAALSLGISYSRTSDIVKKFCYYYEYDTRKRMVLKQLPGADPLYLVYDKRDRLVLSQSGNQRYDPNNSYFFPKDTWTFSLYDRFNRVIMKGELDCVASRDTLQKWFNEFNGQMFEEKSTINFATNIPIGYSLGNSYPDNITIGISNVESVNYYDDYWALTASGSPLTTFDLAYTDSDGSGTDYPSSHSSSCKGLATVSCVKLFDENKWQYTASYYDKYHRVIQLVQRYFNNGLNRVTNKIDFNGQVLKSLQQFSYNDVTVDYSIEKDFIYDHAGRLLFVKESLDVPGSNDPAERLLVASKYDELGRLETKYQGVNISTNIALQKIDYKYNIRGWLTQINDPNALGTDLYGMRLQYNDIASSPQYNGNISSSTWKDNVFATLKSYDFEYDEINRLTAAKWNGNTNSGNSMSVTGFDLNGNILSLKRYKDNSLIDDLDYIYNGNQLFDVNDYSNSELGFRDKSWLTTDKYKYDHNGNLMLDKFKNVQIQYNRLNLPKRFDDYDLMNDTYFKYDANGVKIKKEDMLGHLTEYFGNFVYENNQLDYILTDEGRVVPTDNGQYQYEYFLKDHLGNTRVRYKEIAGEASALSAHDYYPFGMNMNSSISEGNNKYLYNGKKLEDFELGYDGRHLDWYDYGARFYDPAIARWHCVDPLAERYYTLSPYNYVANNPILMYDPDGMKILIWYEEEDENGEMQRKSVEYSQGMKYEGNSFVEKSVAALNKLSEGDFGSDMIAEMIGTDLSHDISFGEKSTAKHDHKDSKTENGTYKTGTNITWDGEGSIGLGHELGHGLDAMNGYDISIDKHNVMEGDKMPLGERRASHMENILRAEQGLPLRSHYFPDTKALPLLDSSGKEVKFGYDYKNNPSVQRNYGAGNIMKKSPVLQPKSIKTQPITPKLKL